MLVLLILVIVAGVVLAIWQPWRGVGAEEPRASASPAATGTPAATEAMTPTVTESAVTDPSEPAAEPTASSPAATETIAVCTSSDVTVTAVMDKESYGSGQDPELSITLTNEGDAPCVMNVGTSAQTFTIESGSDVWWRSTDCQKNPSDQVVQLDPGSSVSSSAPIVWDRTRSSTSTCDEDRAAARPGYYNLTVSVAGIDSEARQFVLR